MYMMSCCAGLIAYISILAIQLFMLCGMGALAYKATSVDVALQGGYWGGFAAMLVFWLIFNCLICCNWKKV